MRVSDVELTLCDRGADKVTIHVERSDQVASPYLYVPVIMPEGMTAFTVELDYPHQPDCLIDLGLFDPNATRYPTQNGFRGWSGGARRLACIGEHKATPGYIPGPIEAGRWLIALGLYKVPAEGADIQFSVRVGEAGLLVEPVTEAASYEPRGSGWYRGDCHCHTFHSDAAGGPEILHRTAEALDLDFLFITDHNTTTAWSSYFRAASTSELIFIPGMEVTTSDGHANALGTDRWIDFRMEGDEDVDVLVHNVAETGALLSVNHNKPPIPWQYKLSDINLMEVWHREPSEGNELILERYQALLKQGRRITAIGGSDFHQVEKFQSGGGYQLGRPTTVVFAQRLDRDGVIAAMEKGEVYITEGPQGPHLEISVNATPMGGVVAVSKGQDVEVVTRGAMGELLIIVGDQGPVVEARIDSEDWSATFALPADLVFVRAEILVGKGDADDPKVRRRRALSNPVYFRNGACA